MRRSGVVLLLIAAVVTVLGAVPAAASTRSFSCVQTTSSRGSQRQAVTGTLDVNSAPHDVLVTRVQSGATEFGPVADPPLNNGGSFAYWHATYQLDGYDLGTTSAPPFGPRHGTFGVPQNPPGITGSTFRGFLYEEWLAGGNWQHWFDCTVS